MFVSTHASVARISLAILLQAAMISFGHGQGARRNPSSQPQTASSAQRDKNKDKNYDADADHIEARSQWFLHGRQIPGKSAAELRHRAYRAKMQARAARTVRAHANQASAATSPSSGWTPLGPVPLASDATGDGFQNYNQVSGRATAVAIDPADGSGNTVFIGGAQGGVWKSTNAATGVANSVSWSPLTDDQATLSVGSIAIQPGNSNPAQSLILVGTGEADNSADSYFGLGILRSADGGNSWTLIPTANGGTLSFSGLGGTRMAFGIPPGPVGTVVAAMAATGEGIVAGALTSGTYRGLYTSTDSGQTWTYDSILPGGASEATSATSVVYNASAGMFFAALRYHGFYSSPDGLNWTPLANQPGGGVLSAAACPQGYLTTCPIYRAEITVVPGRNEMYVWFISLDANNNPVDQGIWLSADGGGTWTQMSDSGIANCGDAAGCGVDQGFYNLALLAVPNCPGGALTCVGNPTDLYAGAINLYKCSITSLNATCAGAPFLNLTHAYGCDPLGAPAHVHPDQHALTFMLTNSTYLMYFANDGGIYRTLDGLAGLSGGSCAGTNLFDDLNQNLGSMTQFVSFSQHPTNIDVMLGGTQDNGSPATASATSSPSWGNVLSGDGGYSAIDPNTGYWFASNPDTGFGALAIQECPLGVDCTDSLFNVVVDSGDVGGDDGSFYFPYILDPQSTRAMLVGTCRVWSGPRTGGAFTELSLNFDTLGLGTCSGAEVNAVRSLAAGGPVNANGSQVLYATTDGLGANDLSTPIGGNVWVTTNASAVYGTASTFSNVTLNGPAGSSINPNQFPISGVAIDTSDPTGNTAYVTVMGFTGGPGHVWQTGNAGANWSDWTGAPGPAPLPDSPANAVVVDAAAHMVYVATDVGVFQSSTSVAEWTEVGPVPSSSGGVTGFLPNVAVTALAIFNSGGQKLLRASTYGRGLWQFNLLAAPDFQFSISNTPLTAFLGAAAVFNGTLTAINGYNSNVDLSCIAGATGAPVPCVANPSSLTPTPPGAEFPAAFTLTSTGTTAIADYFFSVQGLGFDPNSTTHDAALTLHVVNWSATAPAPPTVTEPRGATSPPVSYQVSSQGTFNQSVSLTCSFSPAIPGATCGFTPGASFNLATGSPVSITANLTVPATTTTGPYGVTVQANTADAPNSLNATFTATVTLDPTFIIGAIAFPNVKAGSSGSSATFQVNSQDGFSGTVALSCVTTYGANSCSVSPPTVSSFPATATLTINGSSFSAGSYQVAAQGVSGLITNSIPVSFNVGDYIIAGPPSLSGIPGGSATANLTFTPEDSYFGQVDLSCDSSALPGSQCTLNPVGPITLNSGAFSVTAALAIPASAAPGAYNISLNTQDASGEPIHTFTTALTVQDFSFTSVSPASQTVGAGSKATYSFNVTPVGSSFASPVNLSCSVSAPNSSCALNPASVTPNSSPAPVAITIATNVSGAATPQGSYSVVITGTSGSLAHSVTLPLTVANIFTLAVTTPFPANLIPNQNATAVITLAPNYSGSVSLSESSTLSGAIFSFNPPAPVAISGTPVALSLILTVPNAAPGNYNVTITVTDSGPAQTPTQSVTLPFTLAQDFSVIISPLTSQTIAAGQSITYNLSVAPVGTAYSGTIALTCSAFPTLPGSCAIVPASVGPLSNSTSAAALMTISTTASSGGSVRPGGYGMSLRALAWAFFTLPGIFVLGRRSRRKARLGFFALALGLCMLSCGGGSNGETIVNQVTPVTYTITVTGTDGALVNTAPPVTLIVN